MLIDFFLIQLHTCTYRHFRVVYTNLKEKNQCFQKMLTFIPGFRYILKTHPVSQPPPPPEVQIPCFFENASLLFCEFHHFRFVILNCKYNPISVFKGPNKVTITHC